MTDIFISYANADVPRAKHVVEALAERGWSVWWDRTILAGKPWDDAIEAALNDARCVIVLWSRHSIHSDWVRTEAEEAKKKGTLVPALLDDVKIPLLFRRIQAVNLVDWTGVLPNAGFDDLARAVSDVLSKTPVSGGTSQPEAKEKREVEPEPEPALAPAAVLKAPRFASAPTPAANRRRSHGWPLKVACALVVVGAVVWFVYPTGQETTVNPKDHPRVATGDSVAPPVLTPSRPVGTTKVNPKDRLKYMSIPPGTFQMGCSTSDNECGDEEKPVHNVTITKDFWIGQTEVTQDAFQRVTGENPSYFKGAKLPVENVSWDEAQRYCSAVGMRLPTEAEWEYAARAGSKENRYGQLDQIAWYASNSWGKTHEVGKKQANAWGLYDMLGNVWELVADWYSNNYLPGNQIDPRGPESGSNHVIRGGPWRNDSKSATASSRGLVRPEDRESSIGFRCAGN